MAHVDRIFASRSGELSAAAAGSSNGDVIALNPLSVYAEELISLGEGYSASELTIRCGDGADPAERCTLDGEGARGIFYVEGSGTSALFSGLRLANGQPQLVFGNSDPWLVNGGAAYCWDAAVEFENCDFENNAVSSGFFADGGVGGAIYGHGAAVTVRGCTFAGNVASGYGTNGNGGGGGAIGLVQGSTCLVSGSTFTGNDAAGASKGGGAIYVAGAAATLDVYASAFSGNAAREALGADVRSDGAAATVHGACEPGAGLSADAEQGGAIDAAGDVGGSLFSYAAACGPCPAGTYTPADGWCTACLAGYYNPAAGSDSADACLPCAKGTGSGEGSASADDCAACPPGSFSVRDGSPCALCPAGTHSEITGATSAGVCAACPEGASSSSDRSECVLECAAGTYMGGDGCVACPAGTYGEAAGATSDAACAPCPAGSFSGAEGAASSSACSSCPAGSYSAAASPTCTSCGPGEYGPAPAAGECASCAAGKASGVEAAADEAVCTECVAGRYSVEGASACTACEPGTYTSSPAAGSCSQCPPGSSSSEPAAAACESCAPGTYVGAAGSTACTPCPASTFNPSSAASEADACLPCPATQSSPKGAAHCSFCFEVTVVDRPLSSADSVHVAGWDETDFSLVISNGASTVMDAATGATVFPLEDGGAMDEVCLVCGTCARIELDAGQEAEANYDPCACSEGNVIPTHPFEGSTVHYVETYNTGCTKFDELPAPYCYVDRLCDWAESGADYGYPSLRWRECDLDADNRFGALSFSDTYTDEHCAADCATTCPVGQQPNMADTGCEPCAPGTFSDTDGVERCTPCQPGEYNADVGGTVGCVPCSAGSVASGLASASCDLCPPFTYSASDGATECTACEMGANAPEGSSSCSTCESGVVTTAGSCGTVLTYERSTKTEMWTGLEGGIELGRLTDSPLFPLEPDLTSYNNSDFFFEVPPAPADDNFGYRLTGYFRAPATGNYTFFVACAGQARLSLDGQAIARVDADGNGLPYANLGRIYDQYPEQTSRPRSLVEGKFYLIEALGKVGALSDSQWVVLNEASRLSVGVAMPNGVESKPIAIPTYIYQLNTCDAGQDASSGECEDCTAGTYIDAGVDSATCTPCPRGRFSSTPGATSCQLCDGGTTTAGNGMLEASCTEVCSAGRYAVPGSPSCSACPSGKYIGATGSSACLDCEAGFATEPGATAASACSACETGTYSGEAGLPCSPCPMGRFSSTAGSMSCSECAPGKSSPEGTSAALACHNATREVADSAGLTSALDSSAHGDVIILDPATSYSGAMFEGSDWRESAFFIDTGVTLECSDLETKCELTGEAERRVRLDRCRITENTVAQSSYVDQAEVFGKLDDMTEARVTPEEFMDWAENTGTRAAAVVAEGGGMLIIDSHVNMTRCEVRGNIAWAVLGMVSGGGIQIHRSVVNIVASVFTENEVSVYNFALTYDIVQRSQGDLVTSALALDFPGVVDTMVRNMYLLMTHISDSAGAAISVGSELDYYVDVSGNSKDQLFLKDIGQNEVGSDVSMVGCFFSANKMSGGKGGAQDVALTKHRLEAEPPHSLVIHTSCPEGYDPTAVRGLPFLGSDGIAGDQYSYDCPCRAGTYRLSEGDQAYNEMPGRNNPAECLKCPLGTYSSSLGASSNSTCITCGAGKTGSDEGAGDAGSCESCPTGTYATSFQLSCTTCPRGTYADATGGTSLEDCVACPGGTASSAEGATSVSTCTTCQAGTFSESRSTSCEACPAGTWSGDEGASFSACTSCPAGSASPDAGAVAADTCSTCPSGYFAEPGAPTCSPCPRGTYGPDSEATSVGGCLKCELGLTSNSGSSSKNQCYDDSEVFFNVFSTSVNDNKIFLNSNETLEPIIEEAGEGFFSLVFVSNSTMLTSSPATNEVSEYNYTGSRIRDVTVPSARGLLHLPRFSQVAVGSASRVQFLSEDRLEEVGSLELEGDCQDLALVGPDKILASTNSSVYLACIPGSGCVGGTERILEGLDPAIIPKLAKIESHNTFLVTAADGVLECPLLSSSTIEDCAPFLDTRSQVPASAVTVDEARGQVLVGDSDSFEIIAVDFHGDSIRAINTPTYSPRSLVALPPSFSATSPVNIDIVFRDRFGEKVRGVESELPNFRVRAEGQVPSIEEGLSLPHIIKGELENNRAVLAIPFAGSWAVELLEVIGGTEHNIGGAAGSFNIEVEPGVTAASTCVVEYNSTITAGDRVEMSLSTYDVRRNPTSGDGDAFWAEINGGNRTELQKTDGQFSLSFPFTSARTHTVKIELESTSSVSVDAGGGLLPADIVGSYGLEVQPAAPDLSQCEHSLESMIKYEDGEELSLQVFPHDMYGNPVTDKEGFNVTVDGTEHRLSPPTYKHELDTTGRDSVEVSFSYDGELFAGPLTLFPTSERELPVVQLAVGGCLVVLLFVAIYTYSQRQSDASIKRVQAEMKSEVVRFSKQRQDLEAMNEELVDEVRRKKHSEEELLVMVAALEEVSKERQDELREVMIESKELKIERLLGKGGFGVVNLAVYKGGRVAMKQLLTVNNENVLRFRHECFLMKNLSHPHVVNLVGVCWSEDMFACCLEFVENGSLEDWLRRTAGGKVDGGTRIDGNTNMEVEEAAGWKESVIHRDLKPDNMLLTKDWTLKLTDFGEARAANLGATMTSVGTPIYIAPEVMRADHYDQKADTWYYYHDGWRPILPLNFIKTYPKLHALIQECWLVRKKDRPNFDQIVARLQGEIGDELKRKEEPEITVYSEEDDKIYHERMLAGQDDLEDSEEEGGEMVTARVQVHRLKQEHEAAMAKVLHELEVHKKREKKLKKQLKETGGGKGGGGQG
ncbi:hypothetical protein TeGR_g7773, partial [Tetraparma gracilis]